jgi:hypothetical protein
MKYKSVNFSIQTVKSTCSEPQRHAWICIMSQGKISPPHKRINAQTQSWAWICIMSQGKISLICKCKFRRVSRAQHVQARVGLCPIWKAEHTPVLVGVHSKWAVLASLHVEMCWGLCACLHVTVYGSPEESQTARTCVCMYICIVSIFIDQVKSQLQWCKEAVATGQNVARSCWNKNDKYKKSQPWTLEMFFVLMSVWSPSVGQIDRHIDRQTW